MDNPWANSWGDIEDTEQPKASTSKWSPITDKIDQETDIAAPSWSTGAAIQWNEPSDDSNVLWGSGANTVDKGWKPTPSPFENIVITKSKSSLSDATDSLSSTEDVSVEEDTPASLSPLVESELPQPDLPPEPYPSLSPAKTPIPSRAVSPDGFGIFESASRALGSTSVEPWGTDQTLGDTWGNSAWDNDDAAEEIVTTEEESVDEWAAAKAQKEKQDTCVPPELLASILQKWDELSKDISPDVSQPELSDSSSLRRIDDMEELSGIASKLIPTELFLSPLPAFSKTSIAKHTAESVRSTRHIPFTHSSPLSYYISSKGSTAWEAAVKSRPDLSQDDLFPPGWKILEKEDAPAVETRKKGSGILSFFSRRDSTPSSNDRQRSSSPAGRSESIDSSSPSSHRPSLDIVNKSSPTPMANAIKSPILASFNTLSIPELGNSMPVQSDTPDVFREPTPPSAVSRFLNRFSKPKPSRNSLALSQNDFEFLTDITPGPDNPHDEDSEELANILRPVPLPSQPVAPVKLPPPLSPPPKPPTPKVVPTVYRPPPPLPSKSDEALFAHAAPTVDSVQNRPSSSAQQSPVDSLGWDFSAFDVPKRTSVPSFDNDRVLPPPPRKSTILPQQSSRRTPTAIMSTTPKPVSQEIPKLDPVFRFPPAPSSRSHTPLPTRSNTLNVQSASTTLYPLPNNKTEPVSSILNEGDNFDDFISAGTTSLDDTSFSTFSSSHALVSSGSKASQSSFDDFDDFVSSEIRTPSPPRPPAKTHHVPPPLPIPLPSPISVPVLVSTPPRIDSNKKMSRVEHQRTLSLVETAVAHAGRWPAPPSPIPPTIPPPQSSSKPFDIFGGDPLPELAASPAILQPPSTAPTLNNIYSSFLPLKSQVQASPAPSTGGLSAQDLSFFEGL